MEFSKDVQQDKTVYTGTENGKTVIISVFDDVTNGLKICVEQILDDTHPNFGTRADTCSIIDASNTII